MSVVTQDTVGWRLTTWKGIQNGWNATRPRLRTCNGAFLYSQRRIVVSNVAMQDFDRSCGATRVRGNHVPKSVFSMVRRCPSDPNQSKYGEDM